MSTRSWPWKQAGQHPSQEPIQCRLVSIFMLISLWGFCYKLLHNTLSRTASGGLPLPLLPLSVPSTKICSLIPEGKKWKRVLLLAAPCPPLCDGNAPATSISCHHVFTLEARREARAAQVMAGRASLTTRPLSGQLFRRLQNTWRSPHSFNETALPG